MCMCMGMCMCICLYLAFIILCAVPPPTVAISIPPGDLFIGAALILTCVVDFDPSLTGHVNVDVTWQRGTSIIFNTTDHVSILSSQSDSQFSSILTLYSLSEKDNTTFTCTAGIVPSQTDSLTSLTASNLDNETIQIIIEGELLG